jgi:hypothetical protein
MLLARRLNDACTETERLYCTRKATMKNRASKQLYSYWNEVRGDRLAPRRFEIEPARLAGLLPDAFILERIGDMDIRYRLAGTRVIERFGKEFRGSSFFEGCSLTDRSIIADLFRGMISHGRGVLLDVTSTAATGDEVTHECLILPLVHMHDVVDRFVGTFSVADPPDWLGDHALPTWSLSAHTAVDPAGPRAEVLAFPQPAVVDPHIRTARIVRAQHRSFRVYDGGLAGCKDEG